MNSSIPPEAYISEEWFKTEQNLLFTSLWQFVAPRALLAKNNSFVRRKISEKDIVIQNINGEIKAFENICAHRQNPIQCTEHGVRPLICPYHAWSYGDNGEILNIPNLNDSYRFTIDEINKISLNQFYIHEFGNLVFVNLGIKPINFYVQFCDESLESIKNASLLFDSEVLVSKQIKKFNWKLAYENLRDSQHPQFVHAKTLYKNVKFKSHINELDLLKSKNYFEYGSNSLEEHLEKLKSLSYGGPDEPINEMPNYKWHEYVERYGDRNWYYNWLLYPNLHIASSTGGYSFTIEHHNPISSHETEIWIYYFTGKKKRSYPTSSAVLTSHLEGASKVLTEDFQILENIQSNMTLNSKKSIIGDYDYYNLTVEKWYMDTMNEKYVL